MAYRRTPTVQARLDAQRLGILEAAGRLLARDGLRGCSVTAVATKAGVASGTVYNHFESKSDLLCALFRRTVEREVAAVREAVAAAGSAADRAVAVIETFAGRALKQPKLAYALLAEPTEPAVEKLRLEYHAEFRDVVAAVLDDGIAAGELPPQNAAVVGAALVGAIDHALVGPLTRGEAEPDTLPTLITFALRAVGAADAADIHA
ncbi:MAG: TetR/AcrR family transcriptional regulator [Jatrophihabitans sp.]|uniref:TetR/AcrR family transcriptional regulator n=1 Tax=Jatrophihabitans sp. TaxID=1932789 RepID=UPI003F7E3AD9